MKEEFKLLVQSIDRYYQYSDDHSVWRANKNLVQSANAMIKLAPESEKEEYREYYRKHMRGEA